MLEFHERILPPAERRIDWGDIESPVRQPATPADLAAWLASNALTRCPARRQALVSSAHCRARTALARLAKLDLLSEEEGAACLACPRGGNQPPKRRRTYLQIRAERAAAHKAAQTETAKRARCCLVHHQEMVWAGNRWQCGGCNAENARKGNEARHQREDANRAAREVTA